MLQQQFPAPETFKLHSYIIITNSFEQVSCMSKVTAIPRNGLVRKKCETAKMDFVYFSISLSTHIDMHSPMLSMFPSFHIPLRSRPTIPAADNQLTSFV